MGMRGCRTGRGGAVTLLCPPGQASACTAGAQEYSMLVGGMLHWVARPLYPCFVQWLTGGCCERNMFVATTVWLSHWPGTLHKWCDLGYKAEADPGGTAGGLEWTTLLTASSKPSLEGGSGWHTSNKYEAASSLCANTIYKLLLEFLLLGGHSYVK